MNLVGCGKRINNKNDESPQEINNMQDFVFDEENMNQESTILVDQENLNSQKCSYISSASVTPNIKRKVKEKLKDSPRIARKAISKMTSPVVLRNLRRSRVYLITVHVIHDSGGFIRGNGISDAW